MKAVKERILQEAVVYNNEVLLLDSILNHQVDPALIGEMGREFARRFRKDGVNKVLTIESSGIPAAYATAAELGVPMVFARRKQTIATNPDAWMERVPSFTKGFVTDLVVSKQFLGPEDRVLVIDDIIANGDAVRGLMNIIERSGAKLLGLGIVVEKGFQEGGRSIRERGVRVESLVKIRSLQNGIEFED